LEKEKLVWILGFAGLISAADNWIISPILPEIAKFFSISIPQAGMALTAYMVPYGIMQPIYGFLSDRLGKSKILKLIMCGLSIGTIGCALSTSFWTLCICRIITGFFAAGIIAVSLALIGDNVSGYESQIYVGKFMGIVFLGQGLSVGLGGFLTNYFSWRIIFILFSIMAVFSAFLLWKLPRSYISSLEVRQNFFIETKTIVTTSLGKTIFPLAFATGFLLLGIYGYLGAFLQEVIHLSPLKSGAIMALFGFACLLTGTQAGKLSKKISRKNMLIIGGISALCMPIVLILFPSWQFGCIATIVLGIGYIFIQSTLATCAFDIASDAKGLPSALVGLGLFGGGGLGSSFGGLLLSLTNYKTLWIVFAFCITIFIIKLTSIRHLKFSHNIN